LLLIADAPNDVTELAELAGKGCTVDAASTPLTYFGVNSISQHLCFPKMQPRRLSSDSLIELAEASALYAPFRNASLRVVSA